MTPRPIHRVKERKTYLVYGWVKLLEALSVFSSRTAVIPSAFWTQATKAYVLYALFGYKTVSHDEDFQNVETLPTKWARQCYPFFLSVLFLCLTFSILSLPFRLFIFLCLLPFILFFLLSFTLVFSSSIVYWSSVVLISCHLNVMPPYSLRKPSRAARIYLSNSLLLSNFSVQSDPEFRRRSAK